MAITFKRAPLLVKGDKRTSTQLNALADAFNDRIKSGIADGAWRIAYYFYTLFLKVRNDVADQSAQHDEWFKAYALIDPRERNVQWPDAPPGEEGGANVGNPVNAFVFGSDAIQLDNESDRLGNVRLVLPNGKPPQTLGEFWLLAAYQRGAIDPVSGTQGAPALQAAQEHLRIAYGGVSRYLKSYGGFMPTPVVLGDCGDGSDDLAATRNLDIFFTPTKTSSHKFQRVDTSGNRAIISSPGIVRYPGTCPMDTPNGGNPGNAVWITEGALAYFVYRAGGGFDRLAYADYLLGPFTGLGRLAFGVSAGLDEGVNAFVKGFGGNDSQRASPDYKVKEKGFLMEEFLTRQYLLAPVIAQDDGAGNLNTLYPRFDFASGAKPGEYGVHQQTGTRAHGSRSGFGFYGYYARGAGLPETQGNVTLEFEVDGQSKGTVILEPDSSGDAEALVYLDPGWTGTLKVRYANAASLVGTIYVDIAELLTYQPSIADAYLVARLASTSGNFLAAVDTVGSEYDFARVITDQYFRYGMIINDHASSIPQSLSYVNDNAMYETYRRMVNDVFRLADRTALVAYEVGGDGKSVLWFERLAAVSGELLDRFAGIAPPVRSIISGQLQGGVRYRVVGGGGITTVDGAGVQYGRPPGGLFTAKVGEKNYTQVNLLSASEVMQVDGILPLAPALGRSNEWVMFLSTNVYKNSPDSIFKTDGYSDILGFLDNRCLFTSDDFAANPDLSLHISSDRTSTVGGRLAVLNPKAPSGYNYIKRINNFFRGRPDGYRGDFYRSCQVYQAPYVVESCTMALLGGRELVRVQLKTRLAHCAEADIVITPSVGRPDRLRAEPYRTDENAVREYLLAMATGGVDTEHGGMNCQPRTGDNAASSRIQETDIAPRGSCLPRFYFVKLVPKVYADIPENDTLEKDRDSRMESAWFTQAEIYLRAMCEGYVDRFSTEALACGEGTASGLLDYTFTNLCFEALGRRWLSALPHSVLSDDPQGYGPLPNTRTYAEVVNNFSLCLNKLDKARVELPFIIEARQRNYSTNIPRTVTWEKFTGAGCSETGVQGAVYEGSPPGATDFTFADPGWEQVENGIISQASAGFTTQLFCNGADYNFQSAKSVVDYRVSAGADVLEAIPLPWRDMVTVGNFGFVGYLVRQAQTPKGIQVFTSAESSGCVVTNHFFWNTVSNIGWQFDQDSPPTTEVVCQLFQGGGSLDPGTAPGGVFYVGHEASGPPCSNSSYVEAIVQFENDFTPYVQIPIV